VLHNNDLNQVTWELRAMQGTPKFAESQTLPTVDFAAFAASLGAGRDHGQDPRAGRPGLGPGAGRGQAHPARRPYRPERPTIPPHATFEQAKDTALSMIKGDEDPIGRDQRRRQNQIQEFLPHKGD